MPKLARHPSPTARATGGASARPTVTRRALRALAVACSIALLWLGMLMAADGPGDGGFGWDGSPLASATGFGWDGPDPG
jgi:hypothetical protein